MAVVDRVIYAMLWGLIWLIEYGELVVAASFVGAAILIVAQWCWKQLRG